MLKSTCRGFTELGKEAKFSGDKFQGCIGDDSIVDWFGLRARLTKTGKLESESELLLYTGRIFSSGTQSSICARKVENSGQPDVSWKWYKNKCQGPHRIFPQMVFRNQVKTTAGGNLEAQVGGPGFQTKPFPVSWVYASRWERAVRNRWDGGSCQDWWLRSAEHNHAARPLILRLIGI